MWLLVSFDLPSVTPDNKREYRNFRKTLLENNFDMFHESLYLCWFDNDDKALRYAQTISRNIPQDGLVALWTMTDTQFSRMNCFQNHTRLPPPQPPKPYALF